MYKHILTLKKYELLEIAENKVKLKSVETGNIIFVELKDFKKYYSE